MSKDFYAILGVPRNATSEQIKERFLRLTREKHPDRFPGPLKVQAELDFQDITQAFNVLNNPDRRRGHDMELQRPSATTHRADAGEVARVFMQRGVKAYKAKSFMEAADAFVRATESDPNNALAFHHLARTCLQNERWLPRATVAIERACELEPMKADYAKLAGQIFTRTGDSEKALRYYRLAIRWGGEDPETRAAIDSLEGGDKRKKSLLGGIFGKAE